MIPASCCLALIFLHVTLSWNMSSLPLFSHECCLWVPITKHYNIKTVGNNGLSLQTYGKNCPLMFPRKTIKKPCSPSQPLLTGQTHRLTMNRCNPPPFWRSLWTWAVGMAKSCWRHMPRVPSAAATMPWGPPFLCFQFPSIVFWGFNMGLVIWGGFHRV